jgi:hypothetical protein
MRRGFNTFTKQKNCVKVNFIYKYLYRWEREKLNKWWNLEQNFLTGSYQEKTKIYTNRTQIEGNICRKLIVRCISNQYDQWQSRQRSGADSKLYTPNLVVMVNIMNSRFSSKILTLLLITITHNQCFFLLCTFKVEPIDWSFVAATFLNVRFFCF